MGQLQTGRLVAWCVCVLSSWVFAGGVDVATAQDNSAPLSSTITELIPDDALAVIALSGLSVNEPAGSLIEAELKDGQLRPLVEAIIEFAREVASAEMAPEFSDMAVAVLQRPGLAYVRMTPGAMEPALSGGVVLEAIDGADEVKKFIQKLTQNFEPVEQIELNGARLDVIEVEQDFSVAIGEIDGRLVFTFGNNEGRLLAERINGDTPEWWNQIVARTGVPRPLAVVSLNPQLALIQAKQTKIDLTQIEDALAVTGIDGVQRVSTAIGFDDQGYVHRSWIETASPRTGLLGGLTGGRLTADRVPSLPADTTMALVVDCDLEQAVKLMLSAAKARNPAFAEEISGGFAEWKRELGVEDSVDLSAAIGSPWTVYHSPLQGGWLTGFSAIVPVKNPGPLRQVEAKVIQGLEQLQNVDRFFFQPQFLKSEYQGQAIYSYFDFEYGPFLLCWCLTDSELILSTSPTTIKPILERLSEEQAAGDHGLQLVDEQASIVVAADLKRLLGTPNGLLQFGGRLLEVELQREIFGRGNVRPQLPGISVNLPYGELIRRMDQVDRLAVYPQDSGIMIEGRFTFPGSEMLLVGGAMGATAAWMDSVGIDPMVFLSPMQAKQNQSLMNLRMIGLAMHNYHDAFNQMPKAASTDKDGKPLLSWRVQLLPYLDELELYEQFHLDEPWDSEHNRKLIEKIPATFRSPNTQTEPGYTNYLTIRSPESMFPPLKVNGKVRDRGTRFADITDGTSNTLMVVEANDKSAVIWTQPDDLEPDMLVVKQIAGLYSNKFAVVMGDGAVRWFSNDTDNGLLLKLISRAGGEVVDLNHMHGDDHDHDHDVIMEVPQEAVPDRIR